MVIKKYHISKHLSFRVIVYIFVIFLADVLSCPYTHVVCMHSG